jgi:hypothetical protein
LAESGDFSVSEKKQQQKRRYHIPRKELAKKEIHRLIVEESLSNTQLCERLQIPRRTLERYLHEIFQEDNDILLRPTAEDVAMQANLFIERLLVQRQHLLKDIAYNADENIDAHAKVAAHELAIEMAFAVRKLSINTAADVIRHTRVMKEIVQQNNNKELTNVRYLPLKSTE